MESGEGCEQFQAEKPMGCVAGGRELESAVTPRHLVPAFWLREACQGAGTGAKDVNVSAHAAPARTSGDGSFKLSKS